MHHITLTTVTSLSLLMFTFWNYYVLKHLRLETITFSDATLSDINEKNMFTKNKTKC
jgi:hypothetical protein